MAAKKSKKRTGQTASNFIRAQPAEMSTADVVSAGKKAGLAVSPALIYKVRARLKGSSSAPKRRGKGRATGASEPVAKTSAKQTKASAKSGEVGLGELESAFTDLVADLGIRRAEQLLVSFRERLHHR